MSRGELLLHCELHCHKQEYCSSNTVSSSMQEIANGTSSYQLLNEIMPIIYKRFTDKTAEEWRQIYKVRSLDLQHSLPHA